MVRLMAACHPSRYVGRAGVREKGEWEHHQSAWAAGQCRATWQPGSMWAASRVCFLQAGVPWWEA